MNFGGNDQGQKPYQTITKVIEDEDIYLNKSMREPVEEVIHAIVNEESFGDDTKLNAVMMKGLPGTGKTHTAHYIRTKVSQILGEEIPIFLVGSLKSPDDVILLYNDAREAAKKFKRVVIFDDEVDKYGKRGEIQDSQREATLNQLLMEMQSTKSNTGVISVVCSNRPDKIDSAFRRGKRCGKEITFDPLDREGRDQISKIEAFRKNHEFIFQSSDIEHIVNQSYGAVGADISQLFTDATNYVNMQVMTKLGEIAQKILFGKAPIKNKEAVQQFKDLPLVLDHLKLDEVVVKNFYDGKAKFISEQKDIKDDVCKEKKLSQRYAKRMYDTLNPNTDEARKSDGFKPKKWIKADKSAIDHVLEHFVPSALKDMPFEETKLTFNSFGGLDDQTTYLKTIINNTIAKDREGTTIYLYGPTGAGVTSLARSVAGEFGYNLIVMYGADQESMWVGKVKDRLLEINDRAKASKPTIVVFDNIKYLAMNEGGADMSYKQAATSVLKQIIKPTKGVLYIATGESQDEMAHSMKTLFHKMIEIPGPKTQADYQKIWMHSFNPEYMPAKIEIDKLAEKSIGMMGGDIVRVCRLFPELGVQYDEGKLLKVLSAYKTDGTQKTTPNDIALSRIILG
jgi:SpoVK/Ycf46/Vps4 family AAA+-type ATPase